MSVQFKTLQHILIMSMLLALLSFLLLLPLFTTTSVSNSSFVNTFPWPSICSSTSSSMSFHDLCHDVSSTLSWIHIIFLQGSLASSNWRLAFSLMNFFNSARNVAVTSSADTDSQVSLIFFSPNLSLNACNHLLLAVNGLLSFITGDRSLAKVFL